MVGEKLEEIRMARVAEEGGAADKWLAADLDLRCADHIWKTRAITDYGRSIVLRCRFNRLMTNDLLHRWNPRKYTTDKCEICSGVEGGYTDGVRHALLQCQHSTIHGLITKRHDKAVQQIEKAARRRKKVGEHRCW